MKINKRIVKKGSKIISVNYRFAFSAIFSFVLIFSGISISNAQKINTRCMNCHKKMIHFEFIHEPVNDACNTCHEYNNRAHPGVKGDEFKLIEPLPNLCYVCHESYDSKSMIHTPVSEGNCSSCHNPHASSNPALLVESPEINNCIACHELEIPSSDILHQPFQEGDCSACHDPHQSDFSALLTEESPGLCFSCHKNIKEEREYSNIHVPFEDCSNCHMSHSAPGENLLTEKSPNICFNCHENYINENTVSSHLILSDKKNCANCHSPHASNLSVLLLKEGKDLCMNCHNKEIKTDGRSIENIGLNLTKGKSIHAAIELNGCASCHTSHSSEYPFLLTANYPKEKYIPAVPESFALCFECHDSELMTKEKSEDITQFRDGNTNLHYLHIQGNKGRTCAMCHDMHASSNEHLIKAESSFGSWDMKMNYVKTNTGGSCFPGCHGEESYKR